MNIHHNWSRLFGLSTLTLAMTACQSIPSSQTTQNVARPNIPLNQDEGYQLYGVTQDAQTSAAMRWQSFYTDPKLKALIQMGLDNNKDIKQTILAIQKAQAQYQISDSKDAPNLGLNGGYSRGATNSQDKNPSDSYNVSLGLASYELDFWGKVSSLKEQALQNYLSTNAAKDTAQVSLIANIAKSYVNLSYQKQQLELANRTFATRLKSLEITQARLKAGIDSKAPSLQAAASLESSRIAALNAQSNLIKAENALKLLVGAPIPDDLYPDAAVTSIISPKVISAGLPSDLLYYRPDILQAEYNLKAAGANINVARAAYYPSISLTGNLGYRSGDLSDLFKSGSGSWSFGPSISLPIFDAGQRDANYAVAQIEREQALAKYESTVESAFKEVNDVLVERATLKERSKSEYRLQDFYQGMLDISLARYKAQVDDYLAVLDAERSLFATQQSILNLEQQVINNQIELYQVLGGGANLDNLTVPTAKHRNLVNVLQPKDNQAESGQKQNGERSAKIINSGSGSTVIQFGSSNSNNNPQQTTKVVDAKKSDASRSTNVQSSDDYIEVTEIRQTESMSPANSTQPLENTSYKIDRNKTTRLEQK